MKYWILQNPEAVDIDNLPTPQHDEEEDVQPLSYRPIQQILSDSVRKRLMEENYTTFPQELYPEEHLLEETCGCGNKWKNYCEKHANGTYFALTFKKKVQVYVRKCMANTCKRHFDGQEMGIFNYSGETLVSYALIQDYHNTCLKAQISWNAYIEKINSMYNDVYCEVALRQPFMSFRTFSKVHQHWLHSLLIYFYVAGYQSIHALSNAHIKTGCVCQVWPVSQHIDNGWYWCVEFCLFFCCKLMTLRCWDCLSKSIGLLPYLV